MKLTFQELLNLESRLGKPSGEIFQDLAKMSLQTVHQVIFSSLRHEDTRLRLGAVQGFIEEYLEDGHDIADLLQLVNEVVNQSGLFGRAAGKKEESQAS